VTVALANIVSDEVKQMIAYADKITLTYWGETSNAGMKVKFLVPSNTRIHPFKKFTIREKNKGGQRFTASLTPVIEVPEDGRTPIFDPNPALRKKLNVDFILTHWGETSAGRDVTFLVLPEDGEDEHPFSPFDIGKSKGKGQRFAAVFIQISDDEEPVIQSTCNTIDELDRDRDDLENTNIIEQEPKVPEKKEKLPFPQWQPSRQSGYLCNDNNFKLFLEDTYPSYAEHSTDNADTIRKIFRIASRKELNEEPLKSRWEHLLESHELWKAKQNSWLHGG